MKIVEIFQSIQGEGDWLGTPVIFIRLAGCNLHCPFCDTDFNKYTEMTLEDIKKELHKYPNIKRVVITGGEPTIYKELERLCNNLYAWRYKVHIETNGSNPLEHTYIDWITCSPKADAGYACLADADELKLVVTPEFEVSQIENTIKGFKGSIWLQPEGSQMKEMWKKCTEIALKDPRFRVGVQLHKIMEVR